MLSRVDALGEKGLEDEANCSVKVPRSGEDRVETKAAALQVYDRPTEATAARAKREGFMDGAVCAEGWQGRCRQRKWTAIVMAELKLEKCRFATRRTRLVHRSITPLVAAFAAGSRLFLQQVTIAPTKKLKRLPFDVSSVAIDVLRRTLSSLSHDHLASEIRTRSRNCLLQAKPFLGSASIVDDIGISSFCSRLAGASTSDPRHARKNDSFVETGLGKVDHGLKVVVALGQDLSIFNQIQRKIECAGTNLARGSNLLWLSDVNHAVARPVSSLGFVLGQNVL